MQGWIFRFANVVGSRSTHGVIVDFIKKLRSNQQELKILGDGKQSKPYLHVEECVEGMLYGFKHGKRNINVFNLGVSSTTNVKRIAKFVAEEMGLKNVKFRFTGGRRGWKGDAPVIHFSIEKMKKLGWQPKHTSDEAVRIATRRILKQVGYVKK